MVRDMHKASCVRSKSPTFGTAPIMHKTACAKSKSLAYSIRGLWLTDLKPNYLEILEDSRDKLEILAFPINTPLLLLFEEATLHIKGTSSSRLGEALREKKRALESGGHPHMRPSSSLQKALLFYLKDSIFDQSHCPFSLFLIEDLKSRLSSSSRSAKAHIVHHHQASTLKTPITYVFPTTSALIRQQRTRITLHSQMIRISTKLQGDRGPAISTQPLLWL